MYYEMNYYAFIVLQKPHPTHQLHKAKELMLMKFIVLNFILHKSLISNFPFFGNCDFESSTKAEFGKFRRLTSIYLCADVKIFGLFIQFHSFETNECIYCVHKFCVAS